uniref:Uncharacterized protein n=1 Tax=Ditylum brightwellii TaxID=49249 RepID=A0A6S8XWF6_9STRA|mmetsp:Transcript_15104/g.22054  ORF Transcript_15104/g.22054 Transcript_15104/m.22054 type:complete len:164 (-) Transcript_15104:367-858(-)|eukprot:11884404-Ditylum_brightwellii.AAC.1
MLRHTLRCSLSRCPCYDSRHSLKVVRYLDKNYFSTKHGEKDKYSLSSTSSSFEASSKWRKEQLNGIENKFHTDEEKESDNETVHREVVSDSDDSNGSQIIKSDDELQQMWKDMESRVLKRRTLTLAERGGKVGRRNIRKTDEDAWLEAGLYGENGEDSGSGEK